MPGSRRSTTCAPTAPTCAFSSSGARSPVRIRHSRSAEKSWYVIEWRGGRTVEAARLDRSRIMDAAARADKEVEVAHALIQPHRELLPADRHAEGHLHMGCRLAEFVLHSRYPGRDPHCRALRNRPVKRRTDRPPSLLHASRSP